MIYLWIDCPFKSDLENKADTGLEFSEMNGVYYPEEECYRGGFLKINGNFSLGGKFSIQFDYKEVSFAQANVSHVFGFGEPGSQYNLSANNYTNENTIFNLKDYVGIWRTYRISSDGTSPWFYINGVKYENVLLPNTVSSLYWAWGEGGNHPRAHIRNLKVFIGADAVFYVYKDLEGNIYAMNEDT